MFLVDSWKTLIRVALALLAIAEPKILRCSYEESLIVLKTFSRDLQLDIQKFLRSTTKYRVSRRLLSVLEKHHYPSKRMDLALELGSDNKLQWVVEHESVKTKEK